jgi:hypothetical protein
VFTLHSRGRATKKGVPLAAASARPVAGSYTDTLIFLRPRPPSIQLTPQFRIAVFRKSCPHAESDGIVPLPATFAAGRRLAFRSCAGDHARSPPRAAYRRLQCITARSSDGRRSRNRRSIACHFLSRPTFRWKQIFGLFDQVVNLRAAMLHGKRQHPCHCSAATCRDDEPFRLIAEAWGYFLTRR